MINGLNERQQQILELLNAEREVKITELKELFAVTEMTLRRDLEKLESAGNIRRTFGGAILMGRDIALQDRYSLMSEEKMKIGKKAAGLIQPGDSVFIDAGTTTLQVARYLPPGMNIKVVTNAVNIAAELMGKQIQTLVTGGMLIDTTAALVGPITERTISGMAFDRIFLGATGVNIKHGFSNSNLYEAEIKKVAISQAEEVNIVMDHSKFGAKELFSFAPLSKVHRIVTDQLPADELLSASEESGIELCTQ
ncbi:DeoR family transcriptional regulator [Paenibacillus sp. LMG 31456]|uniref:DeoR family transcriptional regulator n=1 Tax=Paenibacillus foliorum TaxID=2654974 RepID=A0A972K2S2_9BACL|nr:DeoR/GlpR family DNA-binding transcription regulator [Paenibacillus foliorum]NOU97041.1 DeoR family transcriptional regulator [Paenibacillus foliorum]